MSRTNRGVVYKGPYKIAVETIPYPTFENFKLQTGETRNCYHGVIVKPIVSNICGSDMHMFRGRTTAEPGTIFGHEITGEVVEVGRDVEYIKVGDIVSVPFNVSCGRCKNCKDQKTQVCLNVNTQQAGGAYGYVEMGGWPGGQAEFVMVPYADFNLLKFPDKQQAMKKMLDLAFLSDILPTGFDGAVRGGVSTGKSVYIAGAGPVGICCAASCFLIGASKVIVGDYEVPRLEAAKKLGCYTVDLNTHKIDQAIKAIMGGTAYVDCAVDCVGFESNGHHGHIRYTDEQRAEVINDCITVTAFGGSLGIPGVYLPKDNGDKVSTTGKQGKLLLDYGNCWNKGLSIAQGQCPVMRYNRYLMECILNDKLTVHEALGTTVIPLDKAQEAYKAFDEGAPKKFLIDTNGIWATYTAQTTGQRTTK